MSLIAQLAVPTLKHVLAIEDQRARQLNAIHRTVQANIEGPYNSALIHLRKANSSTVDREKRGDYLRLAEVRFIDALGNFQGVEPLQRSWAGIHLAAICTLDNRPEEAREWAADAHEDAVTATAIECEAANHRVEGRVSRRLHLIPSFDNETVDSRGKLARAAIAATGVTVLVVAPVGVLAGVVVAGGSSVAYRTYSANRSRTRLEELSRFVDQVADLMHGLGSEDVARYVLSTDAKQQFMFSALSR